LLLLRFRALCEKIEARVFKKAFWLALDTEGGWTFHCGDACVRESQIDPEEPRDPFPLPVRLISQQLCPDKTIRSIRELRREHGVQIAKFCSHNPIEYARLRGISVEEAVGMSGER